MEPLPVFATIAARWDAAITTGVSQTVQTAIANNATLLAELLTLYVIIIGIMTAFGRMTLAEFIFAATRAGFVSLLLTVTYFNQWIQTPMMDTIPAWIAHATNSAAGATDGAQQFDAIRAEVMKHEAHILQQTGGVFMIGERIETAGITWFILLELTVSFVLWEFARGMAGFLVCAAPFLIGFYLFRSTRHITTNLAGSAVTILLLQLFLSVMLALEVAADNAFMMQVQDAGGTVDVQIDTMFNIAVFFAFSVIMTILIPVVASRIGHGVMPSVASAVMRPLRMIGTAARARPQRWQLRQQPRGATP